MKKILLLSFLIALATTGWTQNKEPEDRGYAVKVGDPAPNFMLSYLDGSQKELSDLKGKVIMLQFTAGWCKVCRQEMPHIEKEIWQIYKDNPNFVLIGVDLKESPEKIEKFIDDMQITYPLVKDENGDIFGLYTKKGAGVTRNIIINREGTIVFLTRLFDREEFNKMKEIIRNELSEIEP